MWGWQVLIQGKGALRLGDPAFDAAVTDLVGRLEALPKIDNIRSPLQAGNTTLRSGDGKSMLVTFSVAGDSNQAQSNVNAALGATSATAADFPPRH